MFGLNIAAQNSSLSAHAVDANTGEALVKATSQLYRIADRRGGGHDTTFVSGTYSDGQGRIAFNHIAAGNYLLRVSYLGYKTVDKPFRTNGSEPQALGKIRMKANSNELAETVVTANLPKMLVKDDTVVYNADAFRVPEGSVVEALVEALPGAKIDEDGKITINGKDVKKFKMDGRDFMTGNNDAVMKNLPSYVIDQVKAYDEKSDLSRMTGLDDGNDDFVLEFVTKRSARKGIQANPDLGYGTHGRYGIRLTAMKPFGKMRYTFMGNANNVNDRNFSGRGGRGRGNGQGQRTTKTAALDASYENDRNLKWSGRVTWSHGDNDNWNKTASESFVITRGGAFSNSVSQSYSRNNNWTANMNLQWNIDSLTTLSFRPDVSYQTNDSRSASTSASFNADPYLYVYDPLTPEGLIEMHRLGLAVNSRQNKGLTYGDGKNANAQLQVYRRLGGKGRHVAISSNFRYRDGNNQNANLSGVHLYQQKDIYGNDSTYQTNRYTDSASDQLSYSIGITYTEPILLFNSRRNDRSRRGDDGSRSADSSQREGRRGSFGGGGGGPFGGGGGRGGGGRGPFGGGGRNRGFGQQGLFLQLNYRYSYSHQKNDPATYDFPDLSDEAFVNSLNEYRSWMTLFGYLDNPYETYLSIPLSRFSERTEYGHNADVQLRYIREKVNLNAGISLQPEKSHYIQQYLNRDIDTVRTVTVLSPTMNLRVRFNQQTNLQVQFRGQTQQPNITQLLDIYDDTNPLNINVGNPGLDPSFTSNLRANFQMMRQTRFVTDEMGFQVPMAQRHWSFNANGSWQVVSKAIGNIVTYNEVTGGRITRPENINGNWNASLGVGFNIGLDTLNRWDISGSINGRYDHRIGYVNLYRTANSERNVTHTYNLSPDISLSYRNSWFSGSLNGRLNYARTENRLQASNNLTTWNYSYGASTKITFPWGTSLSTDINMFSKRGYSDESLNTNELIWNAQLSQGFLRGKRLTVMLQLYDILHEQTTFSRMVNANGWRDQEVNAITSYAMLHVSYRLNFFGGGQGRGGRGNWRNRRGGREEGDFPGGPGGFPGGGPGGFPGGGPGGFPGGGGPGGGF
jgi:hypothetical protein